MLFFAYLRQDDVAVYSQITKQLIAFFPYKEDSTEAEHFAKVLVEALNRGNV